MKSPASCLVISLLAGAGLPGCDDDELDRSDDLGGERCDGHDASLVLPAGFCARILADHVGAARHVATTPSGNIFVAISGSRDGLEPGHVLAIHDDDGDGVAEATSTFGDGGGSGIAWHDGMLYVDRLGSIERWSLPDGQTAPRGGAETLITGLPMSGDHPFKTVVPYGTDQLLINIGSATNACQADDRNAGAPGIDPCPELGERAGVWSFDRGATGQRATDGHRFAAGVRNATALAIDPRDGSVVAAINGRDQLHENWPSLFTAEDDRVLPSEEVAVLTDGVDRGWPYCYHDPRDNQMKLAPEYGGDGVTQGRCREIPPPLRVLPAHWAPLGLVFYTGDRFPEPYRSSAFVTFHGSRFDPLAADDVPGYAVGFLPIADGALTGVWRPFATGFAGDDRPLPEAAAHRPVGIAVTSDGGLIITDDVGGRIWRVTYE